MDNSRVHVVVTGRGWTAAVLFLLCLCPCMLQAGANEHDEEAFRPHGASTIDASITDGVYRFQGNPYTNPGPLGVKFYEVFELEWGNPLHCVIFYPTANGTYPVFFFVGGLAGLVPAEIYSDVLTGIASHGFVVVGVDTISIPDDRKRSASASPPASNLGGRFDGLHFGTSVGSQEPGRLFKVVDWVHERLNDVLAKESDGAVLAQTRLMGLGCHSGGCQDTSAMMQQNSTFVQAAVILEPFADNLNNHTTFTLPALMHGTQLSEEKPECCLYPYDYKHFYDYWNCPKLLTNATGFGHCDIIDDIGWDACHLIGVCKTEKGTDRELYRNYIQGIVTAWLGGYVMGNLEILNDYALNRTNIPIPLGNYTMDVSC